MKPYRLEMGTKFATKAGKDLYAYWRDRVAQAVLADVAALPADERCLINVASAEYFQARPGASGARGLAPSVMRRSNNNVRPTCMQVVKPYVQNLADCPLYTMVFHGATVFVKGARGAIVRYAALQGCTRPEELKGFTGMQGEWRYVASASDEFSYVFERGTPKAPKAAPKARGKAKRDDAVEAEAEEEEGEPKAAKRGGGRRR